MFINAWLMCFCICINLVRKDSHSNLHIWIARDNFECEWPLNKVIALKLMWELSVRTLYSGITREWRRTIQFNTWHASKSPPPPPPFKYSISITISACCYMFTINHISHTHYLDEAVTGWLCSRDITCNPYSNHCIALSRLTTATTCSFPSWNVQG